MLSQIAYYPILGKPMIVWGGLTAIIFLLITLSIPYLGNKGIIKNHYKVHAALAIITAILGLGHALLGIIINFF